jgi:hypothetical protein
VSVSKLLSCAVSSGRGSQPAIQRLHVHYAGCVYTYCVHVPLFSHLIDILLLWLNVSILLLLSFGGGEGER